MTKPAKSSDEYGFGTLAVHYAQEPDKLTGAVIPPIFLTTTFAQEPYKVNPEGYEYSRSGNPNRNALEKSLAKLEKAKHGFLFSSGLAAIATLFNMFPAPVEVVLCNDIYGGTFRYLNSIGQKLNVKLKIGDLRYEDKIREVVTKNTKIVFFETPTNPMMRVIDIEQVVTISKSINPEIIIVVDNTFLSPYFQNPMLFGADVVIHSLTKYINGHSDVTSGAILVNDDELASKIAYHQNAIGSVPSPFDCYMAHRGLKTLHLRMKQSESSALAIANLLDKSEYVESVNYSGLPSSVDHKISKKQQTGFGSMISFNLKGTTANAAAFLNNLKFFTYGESLGGVESLIEVPSIMTHAAIPLEARIAIGITDTLVRISVGIEETEDLVNDVKNALEASQII